MEESAGIKLSSHIIHSGKVFTAVTEHIQLPTGHQVELDIIRHKRSVVLLPMPDSRHVILVRQYRYVIDRWIWELPAGTVENNENPNNAAYRECAEETGLAPTSIEHLGTFFPTPGYCDEEMLFFRLTGLSPAPKVELDADELLEPHTFTLDQARRLMSEHKIIDMKTALGLTIVQQKNQVTERTHDEDLHR